MWEECRVKEVGYAYQYLAVNKTKTISNSMDYIIRKQVI